MVETIKYISEINAISGNEHLLRNYILDNIVADSVEVDSMGNIVALKKGNSSKNKKIAVVTNIDECGMIVTDITDDGYIKVDTVGDVELRSIISKQVIINDSVKGVIGMKAIHLQKKEERKTVKKPKELFIDIGAKNKEVAQKLVSKGDYIAFTTKCDEIGGNIKGKSLSRIGIYVMLKLLLSKKLANHLTVSFNILRRLKLQMIFQEMGLLQKPLMLVIGRIKFVLNLNV